MMMNWIRKAGWWVWGIVAAPIVLLLVLLNVKRGARQEGAAEATFEGEKRAIDKADRDELHRRLTENLK
jgi:hypothetical protein